MNFRITYHPKMKIYNDIIVYSVSRVHHLLSELVPTNTEDSNRLQRMYI